MIILALIYLSDTGPSMHHYIYMYEMCNFLGKLIKMTDLFPFFFTLLFSDFSVFIEFVPHYYYLILEHFYYLK